MAARRPSSYRLPKIILNFLDFKVIMEKLSPSILRFRLVLMSVDRRGVENALFLARRLDFIGRDNKTELVLLAWWSPRDNKKV